MTHSRLLFALPLLCFLTAGCSANNDDATDETAGAIEGEGKLSLVSILTTDAEKVFDGLKGIAPLSHKKEKTIAIGDAWVGIKCDMGHAIDDAIAPAGRMKDCIVRVVAKDFDVQGRKPDFRGLTDVPATSLTVTGAVAKLLFDEMRGNGNTRTAGGLTCTTSATQTSCTVTGGPEARVLQLDTMIEAGRATQKDADKAAELLK
jgi:hypothetical protein